MVIWKSFARFEGEKTRIISLAFIRSDQTANSGMIDAW